MLGGGGVSHPSQLTTGLVIKSVTTSPTLAGERMLFNLQVSILSEQIINIMVKYHAPTKTEQGKLNCYPIKRAQISKIFWGGGDSQRPPHLPDEQARFTRLPSHCPPPPPPQLFGTSYAPGQHKTRVHSRKLEVSR